MPEELVGLLDAPQQRVQQVARASGTKRRPQQLVSLLAKVKRSELMNEIKPF